jgi:hypothetical protein
MNVDDAEDLPLRAAAIVCEHVAKERAPILSAEKSEPQDDADSGWQFLCGVKEENWQNAQVWALHEVLSTDSSLQSFMGAPWGTVLRRTRVGAPWQITEDPT